MVRFTVFLTPFHQCRSIAGRLGVVDGLSQRFAAPAAVLHVMDGDEQVAQHVPTKRDAPGHEQPSRRAVSAGERDPLHLRSERAVVAYA